MTLPRWDESKKVIGALIDAHRAGRQLVPLVGPGLSAEAGLPTGAELTRQMAEFALYVRDRAFLPHGFSDTQLDALGNLGEALRPPPRDGRPNRRGGVAWYIREHNWVDPRQVTADLWAHLGKSDPGPDRLQTEVDRWLDSWVRRSHPDRAAAVESADDGVKRPPGTLWQTLGDWKDLVRRLTRDDPDASERLFRRLHRFVQPTVGHRAMAFLAGLFRSRLILSAATDHLLARAMTADRGAPQTFELAPGRRFPDGRLISDIPTVVYLYGVADWLSDARGERLADPDLLARFRRAYSRAGAGGVLLVAGCGGDDRMVLDLIRRGILVPDRRTDEVQVIWLHYEDRPPPAVERLHRDFTGRVLTAGVLSPGLFLRHLYAAVAERHPAGRVPYSVQSEGPVAYDTGRRPPLIFRGDSATDDADVLFRSNPSETFFLFDNHRRPTDRYDAPNATERLAQWMARYLRDGLTPIWVDLEGQYTIPGVVGAVVDQCRRYDPELPPSVLPVDDTGVETTLNAAAGRLAEALRRGRYFVALDGLEAFPWRHTYHHGTPHHDGHEEKSKGMIDGLVSLIRQVVGHKDGLGGSRIGVAVNRPRPRNAPGGSSTDPPKWLTDGLDVLVKLVKLVTPGETNRIPPSLPPAQPEPNGWPLRVGPLDGILPIWPAGFHGPPEGLTDEDAADLADRIRLTLFVLACFRRTRSLVALQVVVGQQFAGLTLPAALRDRWSVHGRQPWLGWVIDGLIQCGRLGPVEGGLFWMNRDDRDDVYRRVSDGFQKTQMESLGASGRVPREELARLYLLALHHAAIARYYYHHTFVPTRDPQAFFEYVYHRVSSIRYLARLELVLARLADRKARNALADGSDDWPRVYDAVVALLRSPGPDAGSVDWWVEADGLFVQEKVAIVHDEYDRLRDAVQARRRNEIVSFRSAWGLAHPELLARVPAEQLVSWCEWLIDHDLKDSRFRAGGWGVPPDAWTESSELSDVLSGLEDDLYGLWVKCLRERTDRAGAIRVARKHLEVLSDTAAPSAPAELAEAAQLAAAARERAADTQFERAKASAQVARLVDLAACWGATGELPADDDNTWNALEGACAGRVGQKAEVIALRAEAWLRRQESAARRPGPAAGPGSWKDAASPARTLAERGLREVRTAAGRSDGRHPSYPFHRSRLLGILGTARWLASSETAGYTAGYAAAYTSFELARGTLDPDPDRLIQAEIELRAAECALAHADTLMMAPGLTDGEAVRSANAKLVAALDGLTRAHTHLIAGRRNVVWWQRYHRLLAAYKADRNALRLVELVAIASEGKNSDRRPRKLAADFLRSLRHGLQEVGYDGDLTLPPPDQPGPWQQGMYVRLHRTAWLFAQHRVGNGGDGHAHRRSFRLYWQWVVKSVGAQTVWTQDDRLLFPDPHPNPHLRQLWLQTGEVQCSGLREPHPLVS